MSRPETAQDRAIRFTLETRRVALAFEEDDRAAELLAHLAALGVDESGDPLLPPEPDYEAEVAAASAVATAAAPEGGAAWGVAFGAEMDRLAGPRCEAKVTGWIREFAQCGRVLP